MMRAPKLQNSVVISYKVIDFIFKQFLFKNNDNSYKKHSREATKLVIDKQRFKPNKNVIPVEMPFDIEECTTALEGMIYAKVYELKNVMSMTPVQVWKHMGCKKEDKIFSLNLEINTLQLKFDHKYGHGIRKV